MQPQAKASPFSIKNVRLFILFRLFFNSRFYYPVFTILFLDFGLTIEQFALLNVAWALSIVLLEIPSGALADIIGRKKLMVFAGGLMVVEMSVLCFAPRGNPDLLFAVFLVNRILSGAAEAAASGADEALAYDSLAQHGKLEDWSRVLEKQMRMQSAGFFFAMSLGAAVYDPALVQQVVDWVNPDIIVTQNATLRLPLYLTFIMAIITLMVTLRMEEIPTGGEPECVDSAGSRCRTSVIEAFKITLEAGRWILNTPFAVVILLTGLVFDNCIRMVATLTSQYYRLIQLPEATFGLIGSGMAVLGMLIPRMAMKLVQFRSPLFNLGLVSVLTLIGLWGMTLFFPYFGLLPVILLVCVMYLLRFFQSSYLNRITESSRRATVLSFKGLSLNLAYGAVGILYSLLVHFLRSAHEASFSGPDAGALQDLVFRESIGWFPWYFLLLLAVLFGFSTWELKKTDIYKKPFS